MRQVHLGKLDTRSGSVPSAGAEMSAYQKGDVIIALFPSARVERKLTRYAVRFCPECGELFEDLFAYQCPDDLCPTVRIR
jgi:hypothetical protein